MKVEQASVSGLSQGARGVSDFPIGPTGPSGPSENDVDAEVERILAMTDEEIIAALVAEGEDPAAVAGQMRKLFEETVADLDANERMERALLPNYTRSGIFINHNCWKCQDGKKPCAKGNPNQCEFPHARND